MQSPFVPTSILALVLLWSPVAPLGADTPEQGRARAETTLAEAGRALERGELTKAEAAFEKARDEDPSSPLPWLGLAEIDERRGKLIEGLEKTLRAEALHGGASSPSASRILELRSRLQIRLGAVAEALTTLESWRRISPRESRPYAMAALVLRDVDRPESAIEVLRQAKENGAANAGIDEQLGFLLLGVGRAEEALTLARAATQAHPRSGGLALVYGLALAADPEARERAAEQLKKALELGVSDPGRVHLELGTLLGEAGCAPEAVEQFRRAVELKPELAQAHYRLGTALRACGETEEAKAALGRFRQLGQRDDDADHGRRSVGAALNDAQRAASEGRLTTALEQLRSLAAEAPRDARIFLLEAKILFSAGRKEEAVASVRRARDLGPQRVEAHYLEGLFLSQIGQHEGAEEALRRALAIAPSQADAHALLAALLADRGELEEAAGHFQKALLHGAEGAPLRLGYAKVLGSLGREEESRRQMELYRLLAER